MADPEDLGGLIGTEDYYKRRDDDFVKRHAGKPSPPDYYLQYGLRYFRQFVDLRDKLSDVGRTWVDITARQLQQAIERRRSDNPLAFAALERDPPRFREFAFGTHPDAYLAGGLDKLPPEDVLMVVTTPALADLMSRPGIEQVVTTAMNVMRTNGPKRNVMFVVHSLMALEKYLAGGDEIVEGGEEGVFDSGIQIVDAGKRAVGRIAQDLVDTWVMRQTWQSPLFCSWRVSPEMIRPLVPSRLDLDLRDGDAWVSVVPLQMANVGFIKPLLPSLPTFGEVNIRTYVRFGDRRGVYFLSLECGNEMVDFAAQLAFGLPYRLADVAIATGSGAAPSWTCSGRRAGAELVCSCQPGAPLPPAKAGSLEQFLTERYSLFLVDDKNSVRRGDIVHLPWPLQTADVQIQSNTLLRSFGLAIDRPPDHVAFSPGVDTQAQPFVVVG